ncbi:hypothetical protein QYE76_068191 [Lolium multiflorum]|uniref:Uncharacterized protein n=1 Tax=Lolium multiflorum TaxID=4521 RepID=A0AAD8WBG6_LOLMU|nr:hypothetical protein QYE76_068191 [Lolium multiflorum]
MGRPSMGGFWAGERVIGCGIRAHLLRRVVGPRLQEGRRRRVGVLQGLAGVGVEGCGLWWLGVVVFVVCGGGLRGEGWPWRAGQVDGDDGDGGRAGSAEWVRTVGDVEAVPARVVAQPMVEGAARSTSCPGGPVAAEVDGDGVYRASASQWWCLGGLVAACSGVSWASLGTLGLARVLVLSFDGEHWLVQESEEESVDMRVEGSEKYI